MLRSVGKLGVYGFIEELSSDLAQADKSYTGILATKDVRKVLTKYNAESIHIDEVIQSFMDSSSDSVYWVELVGFLSSCSAWYTMHRLGFLDRIRKKQGNAKNPYSSLYKKYTFKFKCTS